MDRIDMIFELLKKLDEKVENINDSQMRAENDIRYHIKRTDLLEEAVNRKMPMPTLKQLSLLVGIMATIIGILFSTGVL